MFIIRPESFGNQLSYLLENTAIGERTRVVPGHGATVTELYLGKADAQLQVVRGSASKEELLSDQVYKSALLLPFPNRIKDGRYRMGAAAYQLPVNEMQRHNALHGFVFNRAFTVTAKEVTEDAASLTLAFDYAGTYPGYPFSFRAEVTYQLHAEEGFTCRLAVENTGAEAMPFGAGWHPYFSLNRRIDELLLQMPPATGFAIDEQMIPAGRTGTHAFTAATALGDTTFDDCFALTQPKEGIAETSLALPDGSQKLVFWQETGPGKYNFLQVYTPPHRQTICIEPMTCGIDAFNNGDGLLVLQPKERFEASFGVRLV